MFERYTDRARRVVVLAQEEARRLNHGYIGTEHLLLGLAHEADGVAAQALESLGISLDGVRHQVEDVVGRGQQPPSGHIPFTPRAKKVMELSLDEATQLGHDYIGTEHILLGLIRVGEGVAAQVLATLGADLDGVRRRVLDLLPQAGPGGHRVAQGSGEPESMPTSRRHRRLLRDLAAVLEENDTLRQENTRLRRLLASHRIDPDATGGVPGGV